MEKEDLKGKTLMVLQLVDSSAKYTKHIHSKDWCFQMWIVSFVKFIVQTNIDFISCTKITLSALVYESETHQVTFSILFLVI